MSLDAGSVYATLGGRFDSSGFLSFGAAMEDSKRRAQAFEKDITASQKRAAASVEKFGHVAKVVATGGALALAGGLAYSVKTAADFERAMRNVNSIAGLTPKQFQAVKASVLDMSRSTAQAPKVLADGLYQIYSSGIKGQGALKVLKASAIAASAGLTDTGTAATAVVGVLNAYHLKASDAARVSDILFQTVNRGVITFPELANTIGTVLPFASALHISLNDVGAAISTLTKEGIPAHTATTDLKNAMSAFLKPSKDMTKAIKETGFANGEALVKTKGFEGALKAVAGTTDGSKSALNKLFPDIRATTAALDLTGKSAKSATAELGHFTDGVVKGASQKVYAEQAKSAGFQVQQLGANLQHAAITLGNDFLPALNKGAQALSKFLEHASSSGNLHALGDGIKAVFGEAVTVVGDFVHVGGEVVGTIEDVAGALGHLAGIDLGNATQIEAIVAAFLGFKAVSTLGPILVGVAQGMQTIAQAAQTAPSIKAFFADLSEAGLVGPIGLIAGAASAAVGALVLLGGQESIETQLAKANESAHKEQAAAIRDVSEAELAAADKGLQLHDANRALSAAQDNVTKTLDTQVQARKTLNDVVDKSGKGSREYKAQLEKLHVAEKQHNEAIDNEHDAYLRAKAASDAYGESIRKQTKANQDRVDAASKARQGAQKDLKDAQDLQAANQRTAATRFGAAAAANPGPGTVAFKQAAEDARNVATAQDNLTRRVKEYDVALARSAVTTASRNRLMSAASQIQDRNAQSIARVQQALDSSTLSAGRQASILGNTSQKVLTDAGNALRAGASQAAVVKILGDNSDAKSKIAEINRLTAGLRDHKIAIAAEAGDAYSALKAINDVKLRDKVAHILGESTDATSKIAQLKRLGIPPKVAFLLATNLTAAGIAAAQAALSKVPSDKTTNIYVNTYERLIHENIAAGPPMKTKAAGRGPGARERAVIGEEPGHPEWWIDPKSGLMRKVTGATIADLGADDYIIPTNPARRGTAMGLVTDLAKRMGLMGYKGGKQPVLKVPVKYTAPVVDEQHTKDRRDTAREHYKKRETSIHQTGKQIDTAEAALRKAESATVGKGKGAAAAKAKRVREARDKVAELQGKLAGLKTNEGQLRQEYQQLQADYTAIHDINDRISRLNTLQETDRTTMATAAAQHDSKGYNAAKSHRDGILGQLQTIYQNAQKILAKEKDPSPDTIANIASALAGVQSDLQDNTATYDSTQDAAGSQTFTDAQQAQLDQINANIALASLTPDTGDDKVAGQQLVDALTGILGDDQRAGVPNSVIADVATQLKSARDNLTQLTAPTEDQQAQIDQANLRAQNAERAQQIAEASVKVLTGAGDINYGFNPGQQVVVNFNSLAPAGAGQALEVGRYVTAGLSMQNTPSPSRVPTVL